MLNSSFAMTMPSPGIGPDRLLRNESAIYNTAWNAGRRVPRCVSRPTNCSGYVNIYRVPDLRESMCQRASGDCPRTAICV
jgi:hypothetical protein